MWNGAGLASAQDSLLSPPAAFILLKQSTGKESSPWNSNRVINLNNVRRSWRPSKPLDLRPFHVNSGGPTRLRIWCAYTGI